MLDGIFWFMTWKSLNFLKTFAFLNSSLENFPKISLILAITKLTSWRMFYNCVFTSESLFSCYLINEQSQFPRKKMQLNLKTSLSESPEHYQSLPGYNFVLEGLKASTKTQTREIINLDMFFKRPQSTAPNWSMLHSRFVMQKGQRQMLENNKSSFNIH